MEGMAKMQDGQFDLAICDPEYGINAGNMTMGKGVSSTLKKSGWDARIPSTEYFDELFRVSKNQIIFGGNYFPLPATNAWIVWDKDRQKDVSFSDGELIWTSFDFNLKIKKHKYDGFLGADSDCRIHKCQKPVKLYQYLLKTYAHPKDKILDTHCGSGSILIAADIMGFDIEAYEIDLDYYTAARARLERHQAQGKLDLAIWGGYLSWRDKYGILTVFPPLIIRAL
jgi:site-specific DNA-methyltransferase (adenine-specific)